MIRVREKMWWIIATRRDAVERMGKVSARMKQIRKRKIQGLNLKEPSHDE